MMCHRYFLLLVLPLVVNVVGDQNENEATRNTIESRSNETALHGSDHPDTSSEEELHHVNVLEEDYKVSQNSNATDYSSIETRRRTGGRRRPRPRPRKIERKRKPTEPTPKREQKPIEESQSNFEGDKKSSKIPSWQHFATRFMEGFAGEIGVRTADELWDLVSSCSNKHTAEQVSDKCTELYEYAEKADLEVPDITEHDDTKPSNDDE